MQVSQTVFDDISNLIALANDDASIEVECLYTAPVNLTLFNQVVSNFAAKGQHEIADSLVAGFSDARRCILTGTKDIDRLLRTDTGGEATQQEVVYQSKSPMKPPLHLSEYNVKINVKQERDVERSHSLATFLTWGVPSSLRLRKRISFARNAFVRYDFSVVKQVGHLKSLAEGIESLNRAPESYELEVEYLPQAGPEASPKEAAMKFLGGVGALLKAVDDTSVLMTNHQKRTCLDDYMRLVSEDSRGKFVGPKLVTLEQINVMQPPAPGSVNIMYDHYTVTEKADGVKRLLYVGKDGRVHSLDSRLDVRDANVQCSEFPESLLDCEYVWSSARQRFVYACFDVYYVKGRSVADKPLHPDRLETMAQVVDAMKPSDAVLCKKFYDIKNPFDLNVHCIDIFAREKAGLFPYETDGLIFTPAELPVGCADARASPPCPPRLTGTWSRAFKWKPPQFNTIDFVVKERKNELVIDESTGEKKLVFDLYVGYNPSFWEPITTYSMLMGEASQGSGRNNVYRLKKFDPYGKDEGCFLTAVDGQDYAVCLNGDIIHHNTVVEFSVDIDRIATLPYAWVPLRVRHDKTDKYLRTRSVSDTANDYGTALRVWSSVVSPVTEDVLCGRAQLDATASVMAAKQSNTYYVVQPAVEKRASAGGRLHGMRRFHNLWIKDIMLLKRLVSGNPHSHYNKLMDIACGKGGDIRKWMECGIRKVLGVDLVVDNICNPTNGANKRLLQYAQQHPSGSTQVVFLPMDASQVLDEAYIDKMSNERNDQIVAKVVFGSIRASMIPSPKLMPYHNLVADGFDLVTCHFAVHYFFDAPESLDAFVTNVQRRLKPGGLFIGTCLDGRRVSQALQDANFGESVSAQDGSWAIMKLYKDSDEESHFGKRVRVYVESIGQSLDEYIVDFDFFEQQMNAKGLVLLEHDRFQQLGLGLADASTSTGTFDGMYEAFRKEHESGAVNSNPALREILDMGEEEKRYSFMHRWFMFTTDPLVRGTGAKKSAR